MPGSPPQWLNSSRDRDRALAGGGEFGPDGCDRRVADRAAPRSTSSSSAVATTPFVPEKTTAHVCSSQGRPPAGRRCRPRDRRPSLPVDNGREARRRSRCSARRPSRTPSKPGATMPDPRRASRHARSRATACRRAAAVYSSVGDFSTCSTVPSSTMRPALITATRWAIERTSGRLWVTNSIARPSSRCSSASSSTIAACTLDVERRRDLVADQHVGLATRARAIATRWRSPPES